MKDGTQLADYLGPATFADRFWPSPQTVDKAFQTGHEATGILVNFFTSDLGAAILAGLVVLLFLALYSRSSRTSLVGSQGENLEMRMWERERQLKELTGDGFTNLIEDWYYRKLISKGERRQLYAKLEVLFKSDQFRHQKHPARVKAQIKARKRAGANAPVTIPGDPPPNVERREVNVVELKPARRRGMISQVIAASKAASL